MNTSVSCSITGVAAKAERRRVVCSDTSCLWPDFVHLPVQVQHRRGRSQGWKLQAGGLGFGKSQALSLTADRRLEAGEVVTMDFDAGRVDSQILLDYGVLDSDSPQVRAALTQALAQAAQHLLHSAC